MKKGEKPKFDYKWWKKNKPRLMGKTGLADALAVYEKHLAVMDDEKMLIALVDVKKKVTVATKSAASSKLWKDTHECLKLFPALIKTREKELKDSIQRRATAAKSASAAPKQKTGKKVVIWEIDVDTELKKRIKADWVTSAKGFKLSLSLDNSILDALEAESDDVTPAFMVEDAQKIGDEVLTKIVAAVEHIDRASRGKTPQQRDALRDKLPALIKSEMQAAEKKLKVAPGARWKKFVARAQQYKDYKLEAGVNLTIGVLGTAGAGLGIIGSGGAGLALGIVALVRSVADTAQQVYNLSIEAEKVERDLEKDLNTLKDRYENAVGTANQGASEVGVSVLKGILGTDPPFIAALPKCNDNMKLWDNKVAGITTIGRRLSGDITKAMGRGGQAGNPDQGV